MTFHVFVEGCRSGEPGAKEALAQALAERYKIPPRDLLARLNAGRFRVKSNLTREQADRFVTMMEELGALCSVVDSTGVVVAKSQAAATPPPPADTGPSDDYSLPLYTPPPPDDDYESGLAAAYSADSSSQSLGALGSADPNSFKLASLDGEDDTPPPDAAPGVDTSGSSASEGVDDSAFLPPDAAREEEVLLAIAGPMDNGPGHEGETSSSFAPAPQTPPLPEERHVPTPASPRGTAIMSAEPSFSRSRFAVGVLIALVLGFAAAHLVGSLSEDRYDEVLSKVNGSQAEATTVDRWDALRALRADASAQLKARAKSVTITAMVVWLLVFGLLLFVWQRLIPWERFQKKRAKAPVQG